MARLEVREARGTDMPELARTMRAPDREEIRLVTGRDDPVQGIVRSMYASDVAWTVLVDGKPAAVLGVQAHPAYKGIGIPWAFCGEALDDVPLAAARASRHLVSLMLSEHPVLMNYVHAKNGRAVHWLKWLGFEVLEGRPEKINGEDFYYFKQEASFPCAPQSLQ